MNEHVEDEAPRDAELDGVMRRIQKLLAIANDGRGDANEAAAAASMAEKILRKYQLDHADVIRHQLKADKGAIVMYPVFGNMKRDVPNRPPLTRNPLWCQHLAVYAARLHDCEVRQGFAPRPQTDAERQKYGVIIDCCLEIYGYRADAQSAQWLYDYLVGHTVRAGEQYRVALWGSTNEFRKPDKVERESFRRGFVAVLCAKLAKLTEDKKQMVLTHTAGSALVLAKKQALEEAFGEFDYRDDAKRKDVGDQRAFAAGVREGNKVDVERKAISSDGDNTPAQPLLLGN